MKLTLNLIAFVFVMMTYSQDYAYEYKIDDQNKIVFNQLNDDIRDLDRKKISSLLFTYIKSLKEKDVETWKGLLSNYTKDQLPKDKINKRFNKLVNNILPDTTFINVIHITKIKTSALGNKAYTVVLKLPDNVKFENRPGFDPLSGKKILNRNSLYGINIEKDSEYKVSILRSSKL